MPDNYLFFFRIVSKRYGFYYTSSPFVLSIIVSKLFPFSALFLALDKQFASFYSGCFLSLLPFMHLAFHS